MVMIMRGKKSDIDFVSNFIVECAQVGKNSPEQIVNEAKIKIEEIDNKIKEVEALKITRSKLLDVVSTFNTDKGKHENGKILNLFNINNHHFCKPICLLIKENPVKIDTIISSVKVDSQNILFCIKQLMEYKIISKTGDFFLRGARFDEYMTFVLQEK